jgi:hypothetical protein
MKNKHDKHDKGTIHGESNMILYFAISIIVNITLAIMLVVTKVDCIKGVGL